MPAAQFSCKIAFSSLTQVIKSMITRISAFARFKQRMIEAQIQEYLDHKVLTAPTMAPMEKPILLRFARLAEIGEVGDIEIRHLRAFEQFLKDRESTRYAEDRALRSLRGFLRYHHKRGHLCPAPQAVGLSSYQHDQLVGA
jgi:hypothetical protein